MDRRPYPVITVYRKAQPIGDRYWYFAGGRPYSLAEPLVLEGIARGAFKLQTVNDKKDGGRR